MNVLSSSSDVSQIILSTAHPAKFSEAVSLALRASSHFNFNRDVMPDELKGLLALPRRVVDVEGPDVDLVKKVIETELSSS